VSGDVPQGELGFRFGEPRDLDGDGHADIAAGARFKLKDGALQNGSATVWSGATGAPMRTWDGDLPNGLFGHWVMPALGLGRDAVAGVVIAAPNARVDDAVRGVLFARSPRTGEELWKQTGTRTENFGWDLALAGDQDGDGHDDLFVGAPTLDGGRVYLVSAKDGALLHTYEPSTTRRSFGWYVAAIGDLDGDGRPDLAAGAPFEQDDAGAPRGGAFVLSSVTGRELSHWSGVGTRSSFGEVVAALGDLDGDGKGEVVVAAPRSADQTHARAGDVFVYSGATGKELRHWEGTQPGELFGRMVVGAGDLDGDGTEDVAISAPWFHAGDAARTGRVELRSGRTGAVLAELTGDGADCWFGWHVRRAPDPEGHGRPTLLIGSLRHPVDGKPGVGVLDLLVLQGDAAAIAHGTTTRGERRSDIK
jgi:hypothetical protein